MTELTDRLRDHNRSEYGICNEAANEIERLTRELANARAIDIHSCHEGCTRAGCVAAGLREQLALAETVRASQVEGLTQGLDALRENGQRLLEIANSAVQHQQDMVDVATAPLHALISALRVELHCLREQMERQKDICNEAANEIERLTAVFDDRASVVQMWRDAGVACFQVASGDF